MKPQNKFQQINLPPYLIDTEQKYDQDDQKQNDNDAPSSDKPDLFPSKTLRANGDIYIPPDLNQ